MKPVALLMFLAATTVASAQTPKVRKELLAPATRYVVCDQARRSFSEGGRQHNQFCSLFTTRDGMLIRRDQFYSNLPVYPATLPLVQSLNEALRKQGVTLVAMPVPQKGMIFAEEFLASAGKDADLAASARYALQSRPDYRRMIAAMRARGILTVDLLDPILRRKYSATGEPFFMKTDGHWTSYGAQLVAGVVGPMIRALPQYKDMTRISVETHDRGPASWGGYEAIQVKELCFLDWPDDVFTRFETIKKKEVTEEALFGPSAPDVVLVGTSFGNATYNFPGFLSQELEVDVTPITFPGGGYLISLMSYLISDAYREARPRVLVWEYPVVYARPQDEAATHPGVDTATYVREVIAAVHGPCEGNALLAAAEATLDGVALSVEILPSAPEAGEGDYLHLEIEDQALTSFDIVAQNGGVETRTLVRRPARNSNNGRFFVPVPRGTAAGTRLLLSSKKPGKGKVTARLCQAPR